jgi:Mlc titration factor MtfA (ptsG expression regulator)
MSPRKKKELAKAVVDEKGILYDEWLSKYNPYYASLPRHLRSRFLQRTVEFAQSKDFRFHELEEDEAILILISGAAVQLTFGLPVFLMDYFSVIHVIRKEYILHHDNETYFGHVSRNGIYISWDHFAKGYLDYTDGVNVGLHEMAHAVSYDVFLGYQDRHDRGFKKRLQEFSIEGGPVFRAMKESHHDLLDSYAATNFDEFWAVCIETFFETPESFRDEEPGLYATICELLNQDPTRPDKIIDLKLAGIQS